MRLARVALPALLWIGCQSSERFGETLTVSLDPTADRAEEAPRFRAGARISAERADVVLSYEFPDFVQSVRAAGDLDGDGYRDLVVLGESMVDGLDCPAERSFTGQWFADFVYGGPRLDGEPPRPRARLVHCHPHVGVSAEWRVDALGDVDADGHSDLLVSAWQDCDGFARLIRGGARPSGVSRAVDVGLPIQSATACFDLVHAGALGDIDGDGFDDFAIGATKAASEEGRIFVFYGGGARAISDESSADAALFDANGRGFAHAVGAGDVDGDGFDDFFAYGSGRAWLAFGGARRRGETWIGDVGIRLPAVARTDATPNAGLAGLGDLDADGMDELAFNVEPTELRDAFTVRGRARFGMRIDVGDAAGWIARDDPSLEYSPLRPAITAAGDVDGDGYADVLYGDPDYAPLGDWSEVSYPIRAVGRGAVHLVLGGPAALREGVGTEAAVMFLGRRFYDARTAVFVSGDGLGASIAGLGDFDGDGLDDLAFASRGGPAGEVHLWFGRPQ